MHDLVHEPLPPHPYILKNQTLIQCYMVAVQVDLLEVVPLELAPAEPNAAKKNIYV